MGQSPWGGKMLSTTEHPHHTTIRSLKRPTNFSYYLFRFYFQALVSLINKLEVSTFSAVGNSIE